MEYEKFSLTNHSVLLRVSNSDFPDMKTQTLVNQTVLSAPKSGFNVV